MFGKKPKVMFRILRIPISEIGKTKDAEVKVACVECNEEQVFETFVKDLEDYSKGVKFIQDCFPYLSADNKEMFQSGLCPTCWTKIMSPCNDEDNVTEPNPN